MIHAMLARWAMQESQFKYGVERLDFVPEDEIIPTRTASIAQRHQCRPEARTRSPAAARSLV
jgi:hypothetical protein